MRYMRAMDWLVSRQDAIEKKLAARHLERGGPRSRSRGPPYGHDVLDFLDHPVTVRAIMIGTLSLHERTLPTLMINPEDPIGGYFLYVDGVGKLRYIRGRDLHHIAPLIAGQQLYRLEVIRM
jgi:hypothetical protein